jgi:hypothetical protein
MDVVKKGSIHFLAEDLEGIETICRLTLILIPMATVTTASRVKKISMHPGMGRTDTPTHNKPVTRIPIQHMKCLTPSIASSTVVRTTTIQHQTRRYHSLT